MIIVQKTSMLPVDGNFIVRKDMDKDKSWLCPEEAKREARLNYIKSIQAHTPNYCPECGNQLIHEEDEVYCRDCGLVVMASISYVAGQPITLPYGLLI